MMELQVWLLANDMLGGFLASKYGSSGIADSRNRTVTQFLDARDEDWLFWVDTDMGFRSEGLAQILEVADADERPVVGGLCFSNREAAKDDCGGFVTFPIPTLYRWAQPPNGAAPGFVSMHDYPRDELVQCDATGSAFILIHRSVFERIRAKSGDNWYQLMANPAGGVFGEDMSFCIRLAEHEIPLYVHTGAKTTHHKPYWVSERHFDMFVADAERHGVSSQVASADAVPMPFKPANRAERRRHKRKAST